MSKKNLILLIFTLGLLLIAFMLSGDSTDNNQDEVVNTDEDKQEIINKEIDTNMKKVTMETTKGSIVFELLENDAPNTASNFEKLANTGFYDGVIFHRVIEGFMIQGGDPTGTGAGDPGYKFDDELNPDTESAKRGYVRGTVAMANSGPNTNGSQFFIMHQDYPLPHAYTIFGRVLEGQEVVDAIATVEKDASDRPLEEVKMVKVTVE